MLLEMIHFLFCPEQLVREAVNKAHISCRTRPIDFSLKSHHRVFPHKIEVSKVSLDDIDVFAEVGADDGQAEREDTLPSQYEQKMVLEVPLVGKVAQNNPSCLMGKRKE